MVHSAGAGLTDDASNRSVTVDGAGAGVLHGDAEDTDRADAAEDVIDDALLAAVVDAAFDVVTAAVINALPTAVVDAVVESAFEVVRVEIRSPSSSVSPSAGCKNGAVMHGTGVVSDGTRNGADDTIFGIEIHSTSFLFLLTNFCFTFDDIFRVLLF